MKMKEVQQVIEWAAPSASPTGRTPHTTVHTGHVYSGSLNCGETFR